MIKNVDTALHRMRQTFEKNRVGFAVGIYSVCITSRGS